MRWLVGSECETVVGWWLVSWGERMLGSAWEAVAGIFSLNVVDSAQLLGHKCSRQRAEAFQHQCWPGPVIWYMYDISLGTGWAKANILCMPSGLLN